MRFVRTHGKDLVDGVGGLGGDVWVSGRGRERLGRGVWF